MHWIPGGVISVLQKLIHACSSLVHLQIAKTYITSRLESVESVVRDGIEDPLDDESTLGHQLDQISIISRFVVHLVSMSFMCVVHHFGFIFM